MFDLAEKLEFTATSEDGRVLDALAHAQRHQGARGEYITAFDEEGKEVDISFATQNWRKVVVDKTRTGQFVRKHFEAMVFTYLAGDAAFAAVDGQPGVIRARRGLRNSRTSAARLFFLSLAVTVGPRELGGSRIGGRPRPRTSSEAADV